MTEDPKSAAKVTPPEWLTGTALAKWDELTKRKRFRPAQADSLAAYCAAFGRWADAEKWLADPNNGPVMTIYDDKQAIRSHGIAPQVLIGERAAKELTRLAKILELV